MRKSKITKKKIFEAAVKEFVKNGFAGARVNRIAAKAGINKERIYAYFGKKENLFIEVWKYFYNLITEEDMNFLSLTDRDIPDLGKHIFRRYIRFHQKYPEFWKIFVWENMFEGKHTHYIKGYKAIPYDHLRTLYRAGQKQGIYIKEVSFETFMFVLISITFFYASNKITMSETLGVDFTSDEAVEKLIHEAEKFLFEPRD